VLIGKKYGLKYVYSGNVPGDEGENTVCSNCKKLVIKRHGFRIIDNFLSGLHAPIAAKNWKAFFNLFNPSLPSNRMD